MGWGKIDRSLNESGYRLVEGKAFKSQLLSVFYKKYEKRASIPSKKEYSQIEIIFLT